MVKKIKSKIAIILATLAVFCFGLGVCVFQTDLVKAQTSVSVLDGFTMNEKASVRRADPVGIRFTVNLDEETRTLYENLCSSSTVEIGSILLPEDMLNGGELTLDTDNVLRIPTEVWKEEDHSVFQSVLGGQGGANLPESYYNRPITARGYIEATDDSGNVTIYYTKNACTRSIGYVAVKAREAGDDTELLEKIAEKTIIDISLADQNLSLVAGKGSILSNALNGEFDSTATKLVIGGIYQDIAENVSYEIANTSVASVDAEGKITAKTTGTTTVTATYTYGGVEYSASSNLTVSNDFVGESDYSILITESAKTGNTNEYLAALKIQEVVKKASGVELPIVTETLNEVTTGKYVSVGKTNLVNSTNGAVSVSGDLDTQSIVTAVDNTLFILGNTEFGTLLGVQQWLGDVLGYDFFLKDTYSVTAETIDLPTETIEYIPQIEYNSIDRNGNVAHEWGIQNYASGVIQVGGNIHNSTLVLSPDTYYSNYADWYATKTTTVLWWENTELITDSSGKAAELCYTAHGNTTAYNAMVATTASKIVEAFNANPTLHRVAFSVRDGYYECNCDTCTSKGNTSDTFVIFLNDVCAKVEESLSGDARQSKFKIVTLAYHQTNEAPNNISSLANYASFKNHVELWFGDSYGDYTDGLKDSSSAKNQEIYNNFVAWKNLVGDNDTLLWVYYTNTKNGFVPYNTFTAIRENYALAYDTGVDNVFNQTIQGVTGWTMLKHYLISKLAWNAKPTDSEWNAWIDEYFENAYGNGATAMREWFNDWLDDDLSAYATEDSDPAIHRDMVSESNFPKATMEKWVGYANTAIAALDENDPNYTRHYNNIVLEKLSPEYFLIELYGMTADYAQEFVWGAELWGITHLGENVKIDATLAEIESNIESATIEDKFFAELQSDGTYLVTLENGNIKAGTTYTLTGTTASSITASVDGELNVSLTSSASVGEANSVMVSSSDYTVTFTNVIAVTKILRTAEDINVLNGAKAGAGNYITGYYLLGNDIDCADALYEAGSYSTGFFRAVFDGNGYTISNIKVGSCGIFGALYGATIKDVNFENVSIVSTANNFNALLAGSVTNNTT
ncbi:MAG: DUF4838 domain-containing protein, partial [Clostridia bacterium]|nr:DUF4838 domain-containing protein [Clostridia bacterium]